MKWTREIELAASMGLRPQSGGAHPTDARHCRHSVWRFAISGTHLLLAAQRPLSLPIRWALNGRLQKSSAGQLSGLRLRGAFQQTAVSVFVCVFSRPRVPLLGRPTIKSIDGGLSQRHRVAPLGGKGKLSNNSSACELFLAGDARRKRQDVNIARTN